MSRTRIRWTKAGLMAGGVGVAALAIGFGPSLLEPPPPEPLPADLGLASGPSGARDDAAESGPPAGALPRRPGDTVIPPPREPDDTEQERWWATDLLALRRLADGLRRRLR